MSPPEYDAFGNPIPEPGSAPSTPGPIAAEPKPSGRRPDPTEPARPDIGTEPRRRPNVVGPLFTILALVGLGVVLWLSERDAVDSPEVIVRQVDGRAFAERSLVRAANLRRAVREAQRRMRPTEEVTRLRLTPEELLVYVRDERGRARILRVDPAFGVDVSDAGTDTSSETLSLDVVRPAAVEEIVRKTLRAAEAGETDLSYLGLSPSGEARWVIGLDDVRIPDRTWVADLAGIAVTRPGERPFAEGVKGASLIRPVNFGKALDEIAKHGRRLSSLRVEPDRIDAEVVRGEGSRDVDIDAALRVSVDDSPSPGRRGTVRLSAIPRDGLYRALRRIQASGGVPAAQIDYAVISPPPPGIDLPLRWMIFYENAAREGRTWQASLDGRKVASL